MRWLALGSRKIRRTCLDCGESWLLDASLARMHAARRRGLGVNLSQSQYRGSWSDMAYASVMESGAHFEQELETVRQLRTCPKCGSDHYKDRRA